MTRNSGGDIGQDVEALQITGFGDSQQASGGQLAGGAAVAEADFAPLHTRAEGSLGAVVGGLNAFVFKECKEPLVVLEKSRREIADFAVGTVQMALGQGDHPLLDGDRTQQQLASVNLATAKLVPESKQSGMLGQRVAAESLHRARLGELRNPSRLRFRCAQQNCALPE
jgi:hypothetical protein